MPKATKHFPLSTFTEFHASAPSTVLSNGNVALYFALWISTTTTNEFPFISTGLENSNVWYPALNVSVSPAFNCINCKSFLALLVPFGFTYTLQVYVSGAYNETCVKYSEPDVFFFYIFASIIFEPFILNCIPG